MNRKEFLTVIGAGSSAIALLSGTEPARAAQQGMTCEAKDSWTQAWIKRLMDSMDAQLPPEMRTKLMEANGRACFLSRHSKEAEHKPEDLANLIAGLKKWSGEEGVRREGEVIYFQYGKPAGATEPRCLCPLVATRPETLSETYCQCSVGYVKEMFERAAGKPVRVELTESLLRGGKACRFTVRL
jgi:hypothetical protein